MIGIKAFLFGLCALCITATDLMDDASTVAPTTPACSDRFSSHCPGLKKRGLCTDDRYKDYMKRNCKKTCDYCSDASTVAPTTPDASTVAPTTPACSDKYSSRCPGWKRIGICTDDRYKEKMKRYCKKTCGYCSGATTTTIAPTNPRATTVAPTTFPCSDSDEYSSRCPGWKKRGLCTDDRYKDYMKRNCKKTCDYCSECIDYHSSCDYWQRRGLCSCLSRYCQKACGICQVPTQPPVVTNGSCGQPEVQQSRVIAGENATRGAWPWQILMTYFNRPMCGGSLVSPNYVVTAAHCVSGREGYARFFKVRVGEHITSTTSDGQHQDIQVEKIIAHQNYSRSTINNDIALMKLKTPVLFTKFIKPVCLPNQDKHVPVGTECFITGWGKIKHPGSMHHTLQQGKMPVVSKTDCTNMNTKNLGIQITDQMVCAGHGGRTRVSGCHGDSGGPFVCKTGANGRWELHGAVSWGSGRCDASQGYSVFARVAKFRSWIDQEMAKN